MYRRFVVLSTTIFLNWMVVRCGAQTKETLLRIDEKEAVPSGALLQIDSTKQSRQHIPRIATKRSALIPGWGQAYNREYWKIPIVYAALAIPTYTYFYNDRYYKKMKFAYEARYKQSVNSADTNDIKSIDPLLKGLNLYSLQTYRNSFRRDRDYSIFWFLILWGVNIVDATVFAHLKGFDVGSDLSLKVKPTFDPLNNSKGFGLVIDQRSKRTRKPTSNW